MPKKPAGATSDAEPRPASSAEAARPAAVDTPAGAKPAAKPAKPSQNGARGGTSAENEPLFLVERILGQRERKGKLEYHIKWLGYDASHNSWEPQENILDEKLTEAWKQSQQVRSLAWGWDGLLPASAESLRACVRACGTGEQQWSLQQLCSADRTRAQEGGKQREGAEVRRTRASIRAAAPI